MDFKELLEEHQGRVKNEMNNVILDFVKRSQEHDMDKLLDERVASVYEEHFTTLKTFDFGTKEYFDYERENFAGAHEIHAQNRHHFYSFRNIITKKWDFKIFLDENQSLKRALNIDAIPHTIVTKGNKIIYRRIGYKPGEENYLYDFIINNSVAKN